MDEINEINDKIIKAQEEQINIYKQMLSEISSQLKDDGNFEVLTKSIDNTLNK